MHLEVPSTTTLEILDAFLRDTWLECCGHLSVFEIKGVIYSVSPTEEFDDEDMRVKLSEVLGPGTKFFHDYDFGSTTHLVLKVISEVASGLKGKKIRVLTRNEPPTIPCDNCGRTAVHVCSQCIYEGGGWLCAACAADHECGEEMLLPIVNSPRVGVCGYTG